jgi:isopentenyl-diphosphate delta-isomerase
MEQQVILVNEKDETTGCMEKMEAHQKGVLHRAFSVFVFSSQGQMLLQQRAIGKYHSGGLWTNACCSHPTPGGQLQEEAQKRLKEEMGFDVAISKIFDFIYKVDFENGLTEHEFDHVFVGEYDGPVHYNKEEVMDYAYKPMQEIRQSLDTRPELYTVWFRLAFPKVESWWKVNYGSPAGDHS